MDTIFLSLFIAVALVNVAANFDERKNIRIIYLTKPLLMPLLILSYWFATSEANLWIVCALAFGWWGDIFLMLPGEKSRNFLAGLVAFLINHLLYIVAFALSWTHLGALPAWFYLLVIPYFVFALLIYRALRQGLGKMKGPVIIYLGVILLMGIAALLRYGSCDPTSFWLVLSGSVVFMISDSILAWSKFRKLIAGNRVMVMASYLLAQFLIEYGFAH